MGGHCRPWGYYNTERSRAPLKTSEGSGAGWGCGERGKVPPAESDMKFKKSEKKLNVYEFCFVCHSIASNVFENHMLLLGVGRYNPFRGNMSEVLLLSCTEIGCLGLRPPPPHYL